MDGSVTCSPRPRVRSNSCTSSRRAACRFARRRRAPVLVDQTRPTRDQASGGDEEAFPIDCRQVATLSYQILKRGSPVLEIASAIQAFALAFSAIRSARIGALSLRPPALMY